MRPSARAAATRSAARVAPASSASHSGCGFSIVSSASSTRPGSMTTWTGADGSSSWKLCCASRTSNRTSRSAPAASRTRTVTGSAKHGVTASTVWVCRSVTWSIGSSASKRASSSSSGCPAWRIHCLKKPPSERPEASSMARCRSRVSTERPRWRVRYSFTPAQNTASPSSLRSMWSTQPPFS
jgi:hypothetical protein